jgi:flagellar assembly protein FliH
MGRTWQLEDFDAPSPPPVAATAPNPELIESERLEAFERGYRAGWDDATAAHETDQNRITAEFAHNLQTMSFTYFEARGAVMAEMETLLDGLVSTILPATLQAALGATILARMDNAMRAAAAVPVEIVVAPGNRDRMERLLEGRVAPPVVLRDEPSLGDGQAFLRFGEAEEQIDLERVLGDIRTAIEDFFARSDTQEQKVAAHAG